MTEEKNITTVLFHQIKNDAFELSGKTNQILIFNGKKKDNDVFVNARNNYPLISRFSQSISIIGIGHSLI